ncbi:MAG TPA: glycosyltransferase [Sphingomicrobium sp.]|nr:glycosyltransferase [Sphingomicrobium sp.]
MKTALKSALKSIFPRSLLRELQWWHVRLVVLAARRRRRGGERKPHPLPGRMIVSLTSYPPRFGTLELTLNSLLEQTIMPDEIVLWIADQDMPKLPENILRLQGRGITIRTCEDLKSYKKLVPAIEAEPGAFIVTADDDLYYEPTWLEQLAEAWDGDRRTILARRAHRVKEDSKGRIAPYASWGWEVWDDAARKPSADILATSGAGALFPPGALDPRVTDRSLFQTLSPTADDLWFYWMARLAGTRSKVVGRRSRTVMWPLPLENSLAATNNFGGNDRQIRMLEEAFGNPIRVQGQGR